jgi:arylsulfatase A
MPHRILKHLLIASATLLCHSEPILPSTASAAERPPNILIITADNLGYGDLPCFRAESPIKAPNFTRLAREGAMLTQFYTPSSTCTVSRACLLTGRIPERHGLQIQLPGIEGNYGTGLRTSEILIPQVLKAAGYATACFGKWNIGFAAGSRPTERGFDEFLGHASGNIDYYSHVYNRKHDLFNGTEETQTKGYSTDIFADATASFIRRNAEHAWFCYLAFNAPHFPNQRNKPPGEEAIWQAPDEAFEAYGYDSATRDPRQRYHAVVTALDTALGRVLDTLDNLKLADTTFVFFYSDNGAFMLKNRGLEVSSNAPLRDGGVTCWEGGIRVAAIARWPGHIAPGRIISEPLWSPDLMIASSTLAGAPLPPDHKLDGLNPLPVLTSNAKSPHRSLYFTYGPHAALRLDEWKIVRTGPTSDWQLFNLAIDPGESTELATSHPDVLAPMIHEFNRWAATAPVQRSP